MESYILEVNESTFERAVLQRSHDQPVIVDFWAPWCGPCRTLGPLLERLTTDGRGAFLLAKVNVDDNPNLSTQYGVRGIPAVKAFRAGQVVGEFVGAQPEGKVREFLRKLAPSPAERVIGEGLSLLATRHWPQAEAAFRKARALESGSGPATLGLAKALLMQGRGCEAQEVLEDFPRSDEVLAAEKLAPLAQLLCEVEGGDPPVDDIELDALYHQSARLLRRGQLEAGMDGLLDLIRQDKKYRKGEPRRVMLALFELLGEDDPITRGYRSELASALF
jgi:putative thioredoxin